MNKEISILREVVVKVTQLLVGKGLRVTQQGAQAFVQSDADGKPVRINIPHLSDDASPELILAIQGFIDHEVGHVLFTEFSFMLAELNKVKGEQNQKRLHNIHNILEDPLVEKLVGEKFPGANFNLNRTGEFFLEKITTPAMAKVKGNEDDEFNVLMMPVIRALSGPRQRCWYEWLTKNGYWEHRLVKAFLEGVGKETLDSLPKLRTSRDTWAVALKMRDVLFPVIPAPIIETIEPNKGFTIGGETIQITGKHFLPKMKVEIGGLLKKVQVVSDVLAIVMTVPFEEGMANVAVATEGGFARVVEGFEFITPPPAPPSAPEEDEGEPGEGEPKKSDEKSDSKTGEGSNTELEEDEDDKGSKGEPEASDEPAEGEESEGEGKPEKEEKPSDPNEDEGDGKSAGDEEDKGDEPGDSEGEPEPDGADESDADDGEGEAEPSDEENKSGREEGADNADGDETDDAGADDDDDDDAGGETGESDESEGAVGAAGKEPGDEEGDEPGKGSGSGGKPDEDEGEENEDGAGVKSDEDEETPEAPPGQGSSSAMSLAKIEIKGDFEEGLGELITADATDDLLESDYRVFTRDYDLIENLPISENYKDEWLIDLDNAVSHMIGGMQKDIERMMAARSQVLNVPGYRSGRLHSAGLHRLAVGDPRVFRRRFEAKSLDTAVTLLIDNSGSMSGHKQTLAMQAAYALSQTLDRLKITHEAIGFTTRHYPRTKEGRAQMREYEEAISAETARVGKRFSRDEPIYMPIYKGFDERLNPQIKQRFASAIRDADFLANNIDGESLAIAASRLAQRKEHRKVVIVLSDGNPVCSCFSQKEINNHLRKTVKDLAKAKIETIGIGINSNAVSKFYDKFVVLNDIAKLPTEIMGQLKSILAA